jgi:flagellar biosynthesis GTPase FlhF
LEQPSQDQKQEEIDQNPSPWKSLCDVVGVWDVSSSGMSASGSTIRATNLQTGKKLPNNQLKIEAKKARLQEVYDHIASMSDEVKLKAIQLKAEKEANTANRTQKSRQMTHTSALITDHQLRSSDRTNEIRTYSRMDLDVWKYDDVRHWFNQYATDVPVDYASPAETGYMIRK